MQTITPLEEKDFNEAVTIPIAKIEVDTDGNGNFQEIPDVKSFNIQTSEEARVARFCSYSFSLTCLNTNARYSFYNVGSSYHNWIRQGRRIKIWVGIENDANEYNYQRMLGRIDAIKLGKNRGQELCTINGRGQMKMIIDYKLYFVLHYYTLTKKNQSRCRSVKKMS